VVLLPVVELLEAVPVWAATGRAIGRIAIKEIAPALLALDKADQFMLKFLFFYLNL
jgi:hypothetical protein